MIESIILSHGVMQMQIYWIFSAGQGIEPRVLFKNAVRDGCRSVSYKWMEISRWGEMWPVEPIVGIRTIIWNRHPREYETN